MHYLCTQHTGQRDKSSHKKKKPQEQSTRAREFKQMGDKDQFKREKKEEKDQH